MQNDQHVLDETLEMYALNRLQLDETETVEDHLLLCGPCRLRAEAAEDYVAVIRMAAKGLLEEGLRGRQPRAPGHLRRIGPKTALAAMALAAAGVLSWYAPFRDGPVVYREVALTTMRDGSRGSVAPAGAEVRLRLRMDTSGLPAAAEHLVTIVDSTGGQVWAGSVRAESKAEAVVTIPRPLGRGLYWVRLAQVGGLSHGEAKVMREFKLVVD